MRKFKLLTTLFASFICMSSLAGCTQPPTQQQIEEIITSIIPSPESIQREGVNIESITFENVPEEIPIGSFDNHDIKLKIVYSDGYIEYYPIKMKNLPEHAQEALEHEGSVTIKIYFRGTEVSQTFKVVQGVSMYLIRYFNIIGKEIRRIELKYDKTNPDWNMIDEQGVSPIPDGPVRPNDSLFNYAFEKWDHHLPNGTYVHENIDVYPLYKKTQKRYNVSKEAVPTIDDGHSHLQLLHKNTSGSPYIFGAYIYAGRIDRVPLLYSASSDPGSVTSLTGSLYFDTTSKTKDAYTTDVVNEIYTKGLSIDVSNYEKSFAVNDSWPSTPKAPAKYDGSTLNVNTLVNNNTSILFEGDEAYSEIYKDPVYSFVNEHDQTNPTSYLINASDDLKEGNSDYRAAIETSVDVLVYVQWDLISSYPNYTIREFEYYFLIDSNNTYPVAEYADNPAFGSTGNKISFNMADLKAICQSIVEG